MVTLPEIPGDAVDAAEGAMNHTIFGSYSRSHEAALLALAAAWPHLYAAVVAPWRAELERQFLDAHSEHCRNEWPHDGACYWPRPALLKD